MFFVSQVGGRFFAQFYAIPWPQHLACLIVTYIRSDHIDEKGRIMRRTIMRYVCASTVMCLSSISLQIKRRFPTLEHITEAGKFSGAVHSLGVPFNSQSSAVAVAGYCFMGGLTL